MAVFSHNGTPPATASDYVSPATELSGDEATFEFSAGQTMTNDDFFVDGDETVPSSVPADTLDGILDNENDQIAPNGSTTAGGQWGVPVQLVTRTFEPVATRLLPSSVPAEARIVLPARATKSDSPLVVTGDLQTYEAAASALEQDFALRVARLRDLFGRVEQARINVEKLQEREEQERITVNQFNNAINGRAEQQAALRRAQLQTEQDARFKHIREAKEIIAGREAEIGKAITAAQETYWTLHQEHCRARDAAAQKQNEAALIRSEQAQDEARKEIDATQEASHIAQTAAKAQQEARDAVRQISLQTAWEAAQKEAEVAREAALAAEQAAYDMEQKTLARLQDTLDAARAAHRQTVEQAGGKADERQNQLETRADQTLRELLQQYDVCRQAVQKALEIAVAERTRRENEAVRTRNVLAEAAGAAGFSPGEADLSSGDTLRDALRNKLLEEAAAGDLPLTRHLTEASPKSTLVRGAETAAEGFALLACGSIFGLSLGIITRTVDLTLLLHAENATEQSQALSHFVVMAVLGTALFYLMGRVTEKAAEYASEELNAEAEREERGLPISFLGRGKLSALVSGFLIVGLVVVETVVEKSGVVKAIMNSDQSSVIGQSHINGSNWTYWVLAAVLSAPFVAFHAFKGAKQTRLRLANRRREEHFAKQQQAFLQRPEVQAVCEAVEKAKHAQEFFVSSDIETVPVREARAHLNAVQKQMEAHPDFVALADWNENKTEWIEGDLATRQTERAHQIVLEQAQNDPVAQAAQRHAQALQQAAERVEAKAQKAFDELHAGYGLQRAAQMVGEGFATGLARGVENMGASWAAASPSGHNAAGENLGEGVVNTASRVLAAAIPAHPLVLQTSTVWQAVQAAGRQVWEAGRAVQSDEVNLSEEEKAAWRKVEATRGWLTTDPEIHRQKLRIAQWYKEIAEWQKATESSIKRLRAQKRQITLQVDNSAVSRIEDARKDWEAAVILWEEEMALMLRLYATWKPLRTFVNWRQSHESRLPVMRRLERARRAVDLQQIQGG